MLMMMKGERKRRGEEQVGVVDFSQDNAALSMDHAGLSKRQRRNMAAGTGLLRTPLSEDYGNCIVTVCIDILKVILRS